jgi:adenosyl cobinamide kinase/adenosyl cobinamide phosphate guanylyltransferase
MESPRIYEEQRENGFYYAEDHGANCAGVFFIGKRCRKGKYIATANVNDVESVKRRIERHANPRPPPPPNTVVSIWDL